MVSLKKLLLMLSCPYQVGDIYITTSSTNPKTKWSWTTWERYSVGRTLVGYDSSDSDFSTVGNTGGAKGAWLHDHTIRLTRGAGPAYYNPFPSWTTGSDDGNSSVMASGSNNNTLDKDKANMPPYIVTYIWRRTA